MRPGLQTHSITEHILFIAGEQPLAASAASIHCIHEGLRIQAEPGTKKWFSGIAVADGRLIPVTDLGSLLSNKPSIGRIIEVSRSIGIAGFRIDSIVGVSRNEQQVINTETKDNTDFLSGCSGGFAISDNRVDYTVIDFAELVHSALFTDIALTPA